MVLSFPDSFLQPLSKRSGYLAFSLHHVCCIVRNPDRLDFKGEGGTLRTRRSSLGGLPLWPGFLLLVNIELAFPHHIAPKIFLHGTRSYTRGIGPAWARR